MLTFDRMFQSGMVLQRQKPVAVRGRQIREQKF